MNENLLKCLMVIIGISALVWLVFLMGTGFSHKMTLSQGCFSCHGSHHPRRAEENDLANLASSTHARGPALTCSACHEFPENEKESTSAPRGCTACHKGKYSLQNELKKIKDHPSTDASELQDCTQCHSFRTVEDSGTFAPNLANYLHFLHLSSKHFDGICFFCHMINKKGEMGMYDIVKQTKEED